MYVYSIINHQLTTFKAIQLDQSEQKKSDELLRSLRGISNLKSETIKFQLYELYDKHLQKEVDAKTKGYHIKEDFAQEMFLQFFEALEKIRKRILTINEFIPTLNEIKPSKNDLKNGIAERNISSSEISSHIENFLTEDNLPQYSSSHSEAEKNFIKKSLEEIIEKSNLKDVEKRIFIERSKGEHFSDTAKKLNLSERCIRAYLSQAMMKIQDEQNILPEDFQNVITNMNNKYKINNIEKVKKALIIYSATNKINEKDLFSKIKTYSEILNISEEEFFKAELRQPQLLYQHPEAIKERIVKIANLLNISEQDFIKIALKQPSLFTQKPETIKEKVIASANLLDISEQEFINAALKQPQLFYQKPETIKENVSKTTELLEISEQSFIKAGLKRPSLFYQKPETIRERVKASAKLLDIEEKEFIKLALIVPPLFTQKPESLKKNIEDLAKELDTDVIEIKELAINNPIIFVLKPKNTAKKIKLFQYYNEIKDNIRCTNSFSPSSSDVIYKKILAYLIKSFTNDKNITQKNFLNYIISNPNINYEFQLPKSEFNEDFMRFTKDFFMKHIKKCNVKFVIVK